MFTKRSLSAVALALAIAAPLTAQGTSGREAREAVDAAQRRAQIEAARTAARRRAEVESARTAQARVEAARVEAARRNRGALSRIPPGQLPPRGMCRVWIDGVAPGQQPAVTSCPQAERDRLTYGANAHVIYGDAQSFPGRGNGKFKNRGTDAQNTTCAFRDAVVVGDRVVGVCRDANGNVINREGRVRRDDDDDFDDDDDDRFENGNRRGSLSKAQKQQSKAARKGGKGRG